MYAFGLWDFNATQIVLLIAAAVIFPLQLLLCFKVKSLILRLCPAFLTILTLIALWISVFALGSFRLLLIGYLSVYYAAFFLLACGAGWCIRAILALRNRCRSRSIGQIVPQ